MQLLSPFTLGGQILKNRVVLAPMTRARCTPNKENPIDKSSSLPNNLYVEHYAQRANGNLLITDATAISEEGSGWVNAPHMRSPEHVEAWKRVVDKVHEKEAIIYLQLWHMGRQSHSSFHPSTKRIVSASDVPLPGHGHDIYGNQVDSETPHPLTVEEIKETIQDYVKASQYAKEAGFDGVEIHSANGYLVDQFLQSCTNKRTDEYGGSMENRVRLLCEIFEAIVASGAFPANRIGFRLSPNGNFGGMGSYDNDVMFPYVAKVMNEYKPAYIHVMDGLGFGFHEKCKPVTLMDIRKNFDGPIISNVGLTKDMAEGIIRSGAADLAAFGRLYISNPDLVDRFANNWPVADLPAMEHWWKPTAERGYTDWPTYQLE